MSFTRLSHTRRVLQTVAFSLEENNAESRVGHADDPVPRSDVCSFELIWKPTTSEDIISNERFDGRMLG